MKKILFLIIMAFAFIGAQGQIQNSISQKGLIAHIGMSENHQQPGVNLVTNGEWESATTGWTFSALTPTIVSGGVSGNCLKIANSGASSGYGFNTTSIATTAGKSYIITMTAKAGTSNAQVFAGLTAGSTNVISLTTITSTDWQKYSWIIVATSTTLYLDFRTESTTTEQYCYFDGYTVREYNATTSDQSTGIPGTNYDVVVVEGKNGQGSDRYNSYDGTSSITYHTSQAFTATQPWTAYIKFKTTKAALVVLWGPSSLFGVRTNTGWDFRNNAGNYFEFNAPISLNEVQTLCYVADGTGNVSQYQNGVFIETRSGITGGSAITFDRFASTAVYFSGNIYSAKLWNRALSIGEVQAYSRATTTTPNLVSGLRYRILTVGTANWTQIGAASAAVGVEFSCNTTAQTGTGTATPLSNYLTFADRGATNTPVIAVGTLNGGFETLGGGGADVFANWTEAIAGTTAITADVTAPYAGTYCCLMTLDGSSSIGSVSQNVLTVGKKYRLQFYAKKVDGATVAVSIGNNASGTAYSAGLTLTTSYVLQTIEFTAVTDGYIKIASTAGSSASSTIFIDNVTITPIGNTLNLNASGIRPTTWVDLSRSTPITGINTAVTPVIPAGSELKAMDFNGTTSKILALPDADFDGTGAKTIVGWFYARGWGEGSAADGGRILDNSGLLLLLNSSEGQLDFYRDNASQSTSTNGSIMLNTWIFYAIVSPSNGSGIQFWISNNGQSPTDLTDDSTSGTPIDGGDLYVGNRTGTDRTFNGMLSPISIYNRVLTASEVLKLYNNTKGSN